VETKNSRAQKLWPTTLPFSIHTGDVDGALPLHEADHLRHRVFGRDRDQYVDMVWLQMTLLDPTFLLRR
jgi:hypothetical protein